MLLDRCLSAFNMFTQHTAVNTRELKEHTAITVVSHEGDFCFHVLCFHGNCRQYWKERITLKCMVVCAEVTVYCAAAATMSLLQRQVRLTLNCAHSESFRQRKQDEGLPRRQPYPLCGDMTLIHHERTSCLQRAQTLFQECLPFLAIWACSASVFILFLCIFIFYHVWLWTLRLHFFFY